MGQMRTDEMTMMQIVISVYGTEKGDFFYSHYIKALAIQVSTLPQYTLQLLSQTLTLNFRLILSMARESLVFELSTHYLLQYLLSIINSLGLTELFNKLVMYVESVAKISKRISTQQSELLILEEEEEEFRVEQELIGNAVQNMY